MEAKADQLEGLLLLQLVSPLLLSVPYATIHVTTDRGQSVERLLAGFLRPTDATAI